MPLAFNSLLDRWKHRLLSISGGTELRDHLLRGQINYQDFYITSTEADTINASPKTLLAAPGSGLVNQIIGIACYVDAGGTQFTSTAIEFRYTDGSGVKVSADLPAAQVNSASDTYYFALGASGVPVVNAVVCAKAASDITAGNGTIYGRIYYTTWKPGEFSTT